MKKIIIIVFLFNCIWAKEKDKIPSSFHNPTIAAFKSFVPGWGQLYNQKYLKAITAIIVNGTFLFCFIYHENKRREFLEKYQDTGDFNAEVTSLRHKKIRRQFLLLTLFSWEFFILDAYVDAHFYKEEKNLSFSINLKEEF